MADYVETEEDNGGVHLNSGIPNRAFALAAVALGGPSWERAGQVWYDTLTGGGHRLRRRTSSASREATVASARSGSSPTTRTSRPGSAAPGPRWACSPQRPWIPPAGPGRQPFPPPRRAPAAPGVPAAEARTVAVRRSGGFAGAVQRRGARPRRRPAGPRGAPAAARHRPHPPRWPAAGRRPTASSTPSRSGVAADGARAGPDARAGPGGPDRVDPRQLTAQLI